jgi:hypothetical protein
VAPPAVAAREEIEETLALFTDEPTPSGMERGGVGGRWPWSLPRERAAEVERQLAAQLLDRAARRW